MCWKTPFRKSGHGVTRMLPWNLSNTLVCSKNEDPTFIINANQQLSTTSKGTDLIKKIAKVCLYRPLTVGHSPYSHGILWTFDIAVGNTFMQCHCLSTLVSFWFHLSKLINSILIVTGQFLSKVYSVWGITHYKVLLLLVTSNCSPLSMPFRTTYGSFNKKILIPSNFHEIWYKHGPHWETFSHQHLMHFRGLPLSYDHSIILLKYIVILGYIPLIKSPYI